ncbi:MAG: HAD family hydrolase [Clostridium sp.]|nr:HAD family hydrolase [Clostridium sp.]
MKIDSIIFDLDGTLWNSIEGVSKTWSFVLKKYDYEKKEVTVEDLYNCMGKQIDEIGEILFPNLNSKVRKSLMNECCALENKYLGEHGGILYDKVEETLKKLSEKYKLFIVSNCQDGYIECFFKAHKLDKYFTDYEHPGRTGLSKGENNKLIIERNNLKNPVYVGDTKGDAESARIAGIPFVFAKYGFGKVEEYKYEINKFDDLLTIEW